MKFDLIRNKSNKNNIKLDESQINRLERFGELLVEKNKVMNLTAITEPRQIEIKHMIDCLQGADIIKELVPADFSLLDIGCGAGFPGIPLKIAFPENRFVLLDSLNKRINFVNEIINELDLSNIEAVAARAEDFEEKETFDICTSRAVAAANVLLEYCMPFVRTGGYCILYKSSEYMEELKEADKAISELGGELLKVFSYELPENSGHRSLIIIKKVKETPSKYPRRAGKPAKSPIK